MSIKLLTEHNLEFLSLKEAAQAPLSLHLSKRDIVGNHVSRLIWYVASIRLVLNTPLGQNWSRPLDHLYYNSLYRENLKHPLVGNYKA